MAKQYLKINNTDISNYVNELSITSVANYNATTNANGDSLVDWIGTKHQLDIGIICLSDNAIKTVLSVIDNAKGQFNVTYLDPITNTLKTIKCLCPEQEFDYYTIRTDKTMVKGFRFQLVEL